MTGILYYLQDDIRSSEMSLLYGEATPDEGDIENKYYPVTQLGEWEPGESIMNFVPGCFVCPDCWVVLEDQDSALQHTVISHPEEDEDIYKHIRELREPKDGDIIRFNDEIYLLKGDSFIPRNEIPIGDKNSHQTVEEEYQDVRI